MTIANNYAPLRQLGNGTTTQFSKLWSMISSTYALVQLEDVSTGVRTTVTQGIGADQYQISITSSGFTVTMGTAPTASQYLNISRVTGLDQTDSYRTSKGFQGEVEENSFDKLTAMVQDAAYNAGVAFRIPSGETSNTVAPALSLRANKYAAWDSFGNLIAAVGTADPTPISAAMAPVVSAATVDLARIALGAASAGANSDITSLSSVTSINGGPLAGLRNRFINGNFIVDQRNSGASQSISAGVGAYSADRWAVLSVGGGTTVQRMGAVSTNNLRLRMNGAASVTLQSVNHSIESVNIYDLAGKTVVLSANLLNTLLTTVNWKAYYANTVDNFSATTMFASGSFTVTSTDTRYTAAMTLPAQASNGVLIVFDVGAQTSGFWEVKEAQIEGGTVATSFERRGMPLELSLCQRYYETGSVFGVSYAASGAGVQRCQISYMVQKRISPTITVVTSTGAITAPVVVNATPVNSGWIGFTAASAGLDGSFIFTASSEL